MPNPLDHTISLPIPLKDKSPNLSKMIEDRTGVNPNLCYHCRCCASGCPFIGAMDYHPNGVIRLVQLGQIQEVLQCAAIWACVGCHTCSSMCPMAIDMSAIMDALRQIAIENGVVPAQPQVLDFHREVLASIERYGRTHKLEIMLRFKARTGDWFRDLNVGLKMLAKRKLDLTPSRVRAIDDIRQLFQKSRKEWPYG
jgi:heterodisulfide reductase subunit C